MNPDGLSEEISKGSAKVYVAYFDYTIHEHGEVFYGFGRERGYFQLKDTRVDLAIRTSRIFRRVGSRWKQTHHHGSIEDSKLLATYQFAVTGKQEPI